MKPIDPPWTTGRCRHPCRCAGRRRGWSTRAPPPVPPCAWSMRVLRWPTRRLRAASTWQGTYRLRCMPISTVICPISAASAMVATHCRTAMPLLRSWGSGASAPTPGRGLRWQRRRHGRLAPVVAAAPDRSHPGGRTRRRHRRVAAAGHALESGQAGVNALPDYPGRFDTTQIANADEITARLKHAPGWLVDARAGERFRGEVEPLDPWPGMCRARSTARSH